MKNSPLWRYLGLAAILVACAGTIGCGPGYTVVPVSGTITNKGEPVAGIPIVFYPKGTESNPAPGPFSKGVTDAEGKYTLETRDGVAGAIVGDHRVSIEVGDGDSGLDPEALGEAQSEMEEAKSEGDKETYEKARKRYQRMQKKMEKLKSIPQEYLDGKVISVTVPAGGTSEANFDLSDD